MPLRLHNTRTRTVEPFVPQDPAAVHIYVCGLTPSAQPHLGHARSFLFFDVLRRWLEHPRHGYRVRYVQNVTDIDDRSIATAQREGISYRDVITRNYADFKDGMRRLGVREPDVEPYATAYIPQIVAMIEELVARGFAYATDDGVYYAVKEFGRYGALSGKNVEELLVGARIAENEHKRDPLDFALWKFAKPGEPAWPSPWGAGRPGWHIECSAMSRAILGVPLDLHGGGYDLIFPHHENEIAQSEPLMPAPPMARHWVHGGLLNFDGKKMSKSLGNFEPLGALLDRHDPLAIRLLFLQTGYRKPMNFTEDAIAGATAALSRLRREYAMLVREIPDPRPGSAQAPPRPERFIEAFADALDDDMNTAGALAVLFDALSALSRHPGAQEREAGAAFVRDALGVLGIAPVLDRPPVAETEALDADLVERLARRLGDAIALNGGGPEAAVAAVIEARATARRNRDFALGDRLRDALAAEGIVLADSKDGTTWTRTAG